MNQSIRIHQCFVDKSIQKLIHHNLGIEHFLIISSTGTGKTTLLNAMVNDTENNQVITIKPQEINIQWIRKYLIPLVKSQTTKKRILLIDEIDLILESSQHLLATILEETDSVLYASCCDPHKVIPSIRIKCMTIRIPILSESFIQQACRTFYKNEFNTIPSMDIVKNIQHYSYSNLTRIKQAIEILKDYPIEKHSSVQLQSETQYQSFIDRMYQFSYTLEQYPVQEQLELQPYITKYLYQYYEENHPQIWNEFIQDINTGNRR